MPVETVTVKIPVSPDDPVAISVEGVKGARCLDVTKGVEAAFGGINEGARELTAEHEEREVAAAASEQQREYQ